MQRARKIGIYKIENLINGKVYIGQSKDIDKRIKHHFTEAAFNEKNVEYNTPIHQAIRKYGVDNFKVDILEECLRADLDAREIYWIKYYGSFPPSANKGYNLTAGGKSATSINFLFPKLDNITDDLRYSMLSQKAIADKYSTSLEMIQGINTGRYWYRDTVEYPIRNFYIRQPRATDKQKKIKKIYIRSSLKVPTTQKHCKDCGKVISAHAERCVRCSNKAHNDKLALPESFIDVVKEVKTKTKLQQYFNASPKVINRWLAEANIDLDQIKHPNRKEKKPKLYIGCYKSLSDIKPIAVYPSMKAASDACGVRAPSMIKKACLTGELYHGYFWKFI